MTEIRTFAETRATSGAGRFRFDIALIVLCGILGVSVALAMGQLQPANIVATSRVLIEKGDVNIQAELEALRAPELAAAVIADLHLAASRDFAAAKNQTEHLTDLWEIALERAGIIRSAVQPIEISSAEALQRWGDVVNVSVEPHTRVLKVSVALRNSMLAVEIADTLAKKFTDQEVGQLQPVVDLDQLRREADRAQAQLDGARSATLEAGMADLPQTYDRLQAKAQKIRALVGRGQIVDAVDVFDEPALRALSDERRRLKSEIQIQSRTLLDGHPTMIELHGRLARVEAEIRSATPKAVAALETDLARAKVEQARSPMPAELLPILKQRVEAARRRLKDQLLKIASGEAIAEPVPATKYRIFVPAEPPKASSWNTNIAHLANVGFYGCGFGLALVFLRRALRRPPVEMPLPVTVPAIMNSEPAIAHFIETASAPPHVFEYGLSYALDHALETHAGPQIVLVHGFTHEEFSPALREFARKKNLQMSWQERWIIVDLGLPSRLERGLGDLLAGLVGFEDVIRPVPGEIFDHLPAGRPRSGRLGLDLVIATLNETYDLVVLVGLDVASADFDEIAPLVTLAALAEGQDRQEENMLIKLALHGLECHDVLILPPDASRPFRQAA